MPKLNIVLLASCALAFSSCSSSPATPTPTPTPAADATVNITGINGGNSFSPNPTTVTVGQRVIWKNVDTQNHDIVQDGNLFTTPVIAPGGSANAITMSTRGTFGYHCAIHPTMVGTVVVQ
jgi:plastocyanin